MTISKAMPVQVRRLQVSSSCGQHRARGRGTFRRAIKLAIVKLGRIAIQSGGFFV